MEGCFRFIRILTLFTGETLIRIVGRIPLGTNSFTIAKSSITDNAFCIVTSSSTGFKVLEQVTITVVRETMEKEMKTM